MRVERSIGAPEPKEQFGGEMVVMGDELARVCDEEVGSVNPRGSESAEAPLRLLRRDDADIGWARKSALDVLFAVEDFVTRGGEEFWLWDRVWVGGDNVDSSVVDVQSVKDSPSCVELALDFRRYTGSVYLPGT